MKKGITRRDLLQGGIALACFSILNPFHRVVKGQQNPTSPLFWIKDIPLEPFTSEENDNYHAGVDALLQLMGENGLKFYRSLYETALSGPSGMIEAQDVVLIKVNAQWKYRGCTNSDLIRGLVQRILDHPDGFTGEVVIFENGQGRGSLNCDTSSSYGGDSSVHANAIDESHSFLYLVDTVFNDPRVSAYLLDPIMNIFIGATDHVTNGYRIYENVSYPCFTTAHGHRVELREGLWQGNGYTQNLKLINVPVLKHHDTGGSEITASLKHLYGILSMGDGYSNFRHYHGLGETCGKMVVSVRTPVLNIIDAIWVSFSSLTGYPSNTTFQSNQILASQDPVALDYWASKYILYPINNNPRHLPTPGGNIDGWLTSACDIINGRGGLYDPASGILIETVTKNEQEMLPHLFTFSEPISVPSPPTDVQASDGTYTDKVQVTWTASAGATSYTVYRATSKWGPKKALGATSQTTLDDITASVQRTYYYYVKASNSYQTSGLSGYDTGYRSDGRPPAPTNVQASDGTFPDKVQITWTASSGANSYTVYRATSGRRNKLSIGTIPDTTFDDITASAGRTYYYFVKASNSYGTSGFSAYDTGHR